MVHKILILIKLIVSEEDYDAFCLAYMFTYRDFEMGTLGLAWTGDLKNAGGVCEKNGVRPFYGINTPLKCESLAVTLYDVC